MDTRPYINVIVDTCVILALIDTGSMVTLVGKKVADQLYNMGIRPKTTDRKLLMANSTENKVQSMYQFHCTISGNSSLVNALYVPTLTSPMVLGMDVIDSLKLVTINEPEILRRSEHPIEEHSVTEVEAVLDLTVEETETLNRFLMKELAKFEGVTGQTKLIEHEIRLKESTPIKHRYYYRNPKMQEIINNEIDKMLEDQVIEPSNSPWSSPIVMVKKPSGKYRVCVDFRAVNDVCVKDAYPMRQIDSILNKLREAKFISTIDLKNGYWQVPLKDSSRPITAFTIPGRGLFQFRVMPFGLHSAPATFQRLLDRVIGPELEPNAFAYLDDIVIVSSTFQEHINLLTDVFHRLRQAGLALNPSKCHFCKKELTYLGHVVNGLGIHTDPDKIKAISDFPAPKTVRHLRSFLGLASWYRRFVENFSRISAPLTHLLKKNVRWEWSQKQENAFHALKEKLISAPILSCPDFEASFTLRVDASDNGLGAALTQVQGGKEVVIAFGSRLLSESERKYTVTEKECLALVWGVRKYRAYLEGYHFIAETDHQSLKWLMHLEKPTGRLARWVLELQQMDFEVKYRKGTQNRVADALSRYPVEVSEPAETEERVVAAMETKTIEGKEDNGGEAQVETTEDEGVWYKRILQKVKEEPWKFPNYRIDDGRLLRRTRTSSNKAENYDATLEWKMCVPEHLRKRVLLENHDQATAGHLGSYKTSKRVSDRYFWPGWKRDVRQYVRSCESCQRHKVEQLPPVGYMYLRQPKGPWVSVSTDLMGPLPRTKRGNRFILLFQDTFSKWIEMIPLKSATAQKVAQSFRDLILLRFGAPEIVITDNGSQYTSRIFHEITTDWNITHQFTAPYSPQSNPAERPNRVVKTMITQYIKSDHREWDEHLGEFRFALNTAIHSSTKYSPAMLNFGRELRMPKAICGPTLASNGNKAEGEAYEHQLEKLQRLVIKVRNNLTKAYQQQARHYNLRRRENVFKVGDKVLKRAHPQSKAAEFVASKLYPKFDGPFVIERPVGANMFQLRGKNPIIVHAKDLKLYRD